MEHHIVFYDPALFSGWPANNGAWSWMDGASFEMLVGFTSGNYLFQPGHHISKPYQNRLARSLDGGHSWRVEVPVPYIHEELPPAAVPLPEPLDFHHAHLCLRLIGEGYHGSAQPAGGFFFSLDRGKHWQGPFSLTGLPGSAELAGMEITARTDVIFQSADSALFFLSARPKDCWGADRVFAAKTIDGGCSFSFLSWIVPPQDAYRAVMPSTVCAQDHSLVSAIRRRDMAHDFGWIDVYRSLDGGASWQFGSKLADTGARNGNPPALLSLFDGRLCCVYGNRSTRQLLASFSTDCGITWGHELVLRQGEPSSAEHHADFGYPRLFQRPDGCLVCCYYWADRIHPRQHIAATIWDPKPI